MDPLTPLAVVGAVALIATVALARVTAELRDGSSWRISAITICAVLFALTVWPIYAAILPGAPVAEAHNIAESGIIPLPEGFAGPTRILINGSLAGDSNAEARVSLISGTTRESLALTRHFDKARVGRSGRTTVERIVDSQVASMRVPPDTRQVAVSITGSALNADGLTAKVYRDLCPLPVLIAADLVAVLVLVIMAIRGGDRRIIAAGGALVGFGVAATEVIEPGSMLRPLVGSLLIGGVAGAFVAGFIGSLAARVMVKPAAVRAARAT
jgi:hypothetical protein